MRGIRKVLIALNGNKGVLEHGLELACDESCWVTVIKVLPPYEGDLNLTGVKDIEGALTSGEDNIRNDIKAAAEEKRVLIKTRIENGAPHEKIIEAAQQERCDLIIMGPSKKGLLRKLFGDRTVERVISQAPCPVLVV